MLTAQTSSLALANPDGNGSHRIVYDLWGDINAARGVVACVHGLTRNRHDFDILAAALANEGYAVLCPDIAGRGESERFTNPICYNNAVYAADMLSLLQQLNITRVYWVGTSMGGLIAMIIANTAPGLMQKLVLNDIGCVLKAEALLRIREYVGKPNIFADFHAAEEALKLRTAPFGIPDEYWNSFAKNSINILPDGSAALAYDPLIAQAFNATNNIVDIELWPLWEAVKPIPTLLIRGETSDILSAETAQKMGCKYYYEVASVGHAPALMTQAEIARISSFLSSDAASTV